MFDAVKMSFVCVDPKCFQLQCTLAGIRWDKTAKLCKNLITKKECHHDWFEFQNDTRRAFLFNRCITHKCTGRYWQQGNMVLQNIFVCKTGTPTVWRTFYLIWFDLINFLNRIEWRALCDRLNNNNERNLHTKNITSEPSAYFLSSFVSPLWCCPTYFKTPPSRLHILRCLEAACSTWRGMLRLPTPGYSGKYARLYR